MPCVNVLPSEVLVHILQFLSDPFEIQNCYETCKSLYHSSQHQSLWKNVNLSRHGERIDDYALSTILRPSSRMSYVNSLNLSGCRKLKGDSLKASLAGSESSLTSLDLSYCAKLDSLILVQALAYCKHTLRFLSLRHVDHLLNDAALEQMLDALSTCTSNNGDSADNNNNNNKNNTARPSLLPYYFSSYTPGLLSLNLGTSTRWMGKNLRLTDRSLYLITASCKNLECLYLQNQDGLTDEGMYRLGEGGLKLKKLELSLCCKITDNGIMSLPSSLEVLELKNCWRVTGASISHLFQRANNLRSLNLSGCAFLTGEIFRINNNSNNTLLTEVHLSRVNRMRDEDVRLLYKAAGKSLKQVSLALCDLITNDAIHDLCLHCDLESLNVADCQEIDINFIHSLAVQDTKKQPLRTLLSFNIRQSKGWSDSTTYMLLSERCCGASRLQKLFLGSTVAGGGSSSTNNNNSDSENERWNNRREGAGVGDASLMEIARYLHRSIQVLDVEGCSNITTEGAISLLRSCRQIKKLNLSGLYKLDDRLVHYISGGHANNLREIFFNFCPGLTSHALYALRKRREEGGLKVWDRKIAHLQGAKPF